MIIVLIPIFFAAAIYGVYRLFLIVSAGYGLAAGIACVIAITAAVIGPAIYFWQRHRVLHGRRVNGRRILELSGDWGRLALNAEEKRGHLTLGGEDIRFIFGDIDAVGADASAAKPALLLRLRGQPRPQWRIPMTNGRQARDWQKILGLAASKTL